jgi:integrase
MENEEILALSPYDNFVYALKAESCKRQYPRKLDRFLSFVGLEGTIQEKCNKLFDISCNKELFQSHLIRFINFQKQRIQNKEISEATLGNYVKTIKLFCSMNDIIINWKKISKGMPPVKSYSDDRIPTVDEIQKLIEHPDRRIKTIVLVMVSSGVRVGSWDYLQWKHIVPIERDGVIVAAKILVKNTKINNHGYYSFITPEAYGSLKDWMDFRKLHGEEITQESWLMRNTWQKLDRRRGNGLGLARYPKRLDSPSIKNMIYDAWKIQGIRSTLEGGNKRHEFKSTHGFRKFFETKCQKAKMNHNNIKILMDHSLGESQNYHRPTQDELLDDYLNAIDLLTINDENKLKKKIFELTEKQSEIDLMKLKHEKEMKEMREQISVLITSFKSIDRPSKNEIAKQLVTKGIYRPQSSDEFTS